MSANIVKNTHAYQVIPIPVYAYYAYQVDSDMAKGEGPKKRILCIPRLFIREFPLKKAMWAYISKIPMHTRSYRFWYAHTTHTKTGR